MDGDENLVRGICVEMCAHIANAWEQTQQTHFIYVRMIIYSFVIRDFGVRSLNLFNAPFDFGWLFAMRYGFPMFIETIVSSRMHIAHCTDVSFLYVLRLNNIAYKYNFRKLCLSFWVEWIVVCLD